MPRPSGMRAVVIGVVAVITCAVASPVWGQESKAILLIHIYGYDAPARAPFDAAFTRTLRAADDIAVDLYIETLDSNRFGGETQAQLTRAYLRERYADKKLAAVATAYDRALSFLLDPRDPLFPDVPVAALVTGFPQATPGHVAVIWDGAMVGQSADVALKLQPHLRRLALIDSAPPAPGSDVVYLEARRQLAAVAPQVPVIALRNLGLDELLARVRALPPDAAVVIARQTIGRHGNTVSTAAAIREVAAAAPVPVYVVSDLQIGSGAVGGMVISIEKSASRLADLALGIARTGRPLHTAPEQSVPVPTFDWRALKRWGVDESRLPAGSVILHRQPTVWDEYQGYIVGSAALVALQSALIVGLVLQRRRRRRSELALKGSEQQLRESVSQRQDLAGRLIRAQEEERARVARDLHDDLGQQLAGVSILLSGLKRRSGAPGASADVERTLTSLQERTAALAQTVRSLSHDLHPSVLHHAGLVAVLQRHCAGVEQHHRVRVTLSAEEGADALAPDIALCLYRVAQEAMTNAARHARAQAIRVQLTATEDSVELSIIDDGVGFVIGERARAGLGLRSAGERVRLVRGSLTLDSRPGHGTTLLVRVPRRLVVP